MTDDPRILAGLKAQALARRRLLEAGARRLGWKAEIVRQLADALPGAEDRLRVGDVVITGSAVPAIPVAPGDRVEVRAPGLGAVAVELA